MPRTIREKGIGLAASLAEQETMAQRAILFRSSEKEKQRFTRSGNLYELRMTRKRNERLRTTRTFMAVGVVNGEMGFDEYLGMIVAGDVDEYGEEETNASMRWTRLYIAPHTRTLKNSPDT